MKKLADSAALNAELTLEKWESEAAMSLELIKQTGKLAERVNTLEQRTERQEKLDL